MSDTSTREFEVGDGTMAELVRLSSAGHVTMDEVIRYAVSEYYGRNYQTIMRTGFMVPPDC